MATLRETRYYASIPKLLLYILIIAGIGAGCWAALAAPRPGSPVVVYWVCLALLGLSMTAFLIMFVVTVLRLKPLLQIDEIGFTSAPLLSRKPPTFVPWSEVARIGVRVQRLNQKRRLPVKMYYIAVYERYEDGAEEESASDLGLAHVETSESMSFEYAPILLPLNLMFLHASRRRRVQALERIKSDFAPEMTQYRIAVDGEERPLWG